MAGNVTFTDEIDRVLSTTRSDIMPMVWDNITTDIPLIHYLVQEKKVRVGGAYLEGTVLKELPSAIGAAPTAATVVPVYLDPATRFRYAWKNIYVPFKIPGPDIRKNKGPNKVLDIIGLSLDAVQAGMVQGLGGTSLGIWGPATNDEANESVLTSLLNLVKSSANTTGTTGTLSRTNAWWQNSTGTAITDFGTNGLTRWREAMFNAKRGNDIPDVVVTNQTQYLNFLNTLQANFRYNLPVEFRLSSRRTVDIGMDDVGFHGAVVIEDANAQADVARMINTKYLYLYVDEDSFLVLMPFISMLSQGEDAVASAAIAMCNMVCGNLARQGVVTGGDTD